jgi:fused signal recognition particle receptor
MDQNFTSMITLVESNLNLIFLGVIFVLAAAFGLMWIRGRRARLLMGSQENKQTSEQTSEQTSRQTSRSDELMSGKPADDKKPRIEKKEEPAVEATLKSALAPTQKNFLGRIRALFVEGNQSSHLDEIEEILYTSDLGPQTVQRLMGSLADQLSRADKNNYALIVEILKKEMLEIFAHSNSSSDSSSSSAATSEIHFATSGPTVLMVVGVNGAGKTTSIGKIAAQMAAQGKKVLVAAGDTFRAAAGQQLKAWTERAQVEIFSPEGVMDPSAVAYDAVIKAKARGYDVVIIDTAGRLHTQVNLMDELKKVKRVVTKVIPEAPHEILVVLDANSGQNALIQAREYNQVLGLTGVILTKMDGTAKGGVAVGIAYELKLPIKLVGIGEKIGDLQAFSSAEFVASIFD